MKQQKIGFALEHENFENGQNMNYGQQIYEEPELSFLDYLGRVLIDFFIIYGAYASIRDLILSFL